MRSTLAAACLVSAFLIGCSEPVQQVAPPADDTEIPEKQSVEASISSWQDITSAIASHEGKVVVVDLWSTTCAPCRREFPGLVKLHEQHAGKVACISVSLDYYGDTNEPPESFQAAVSQFLTEQRADFENFICSDASDEVLAKLEATAVPVVLIYGQDGELLQMFEDDGSFGDEGFTYHDHVAPLVVQSLGTE